MNLLVDIGNTRIKWALHSTDDWQGRGFVIDSKNLSRQLDQQWSSLVQPDRVVVVTVNNPAVNRIAEQWIAKHWQINVQYVKSEQEYAGMENAYDKSEMLGNDRWVAAVGAQGISTPPFCVVDCGTAVTIDVVDEQNRFCGGFIFPGLHLLQNSLLAGTNGIDQATEKYVLSPSGNTADGLASGSLFGLIGAIEYFIRYYKIRFGADLTVVLTGGDADLLQQYLQVDAIVEPNLVLKGLARYI